MRLMKDDLLWASICEAYNKHTSYARQSCCKRLREQQTSNSAILSRQSAISGQSTVYHVLLVNTILPQKHGNLPIAESHYHMWTIQGQKKPNTWNAGWHRSSKTIKWFSKTGRQLQEELRHRCVIKLTYCHGYNPALSVQPDLSLLCLGNLLLELQ